MSPVVGQIVEPGTSILGEGSVNFKVGDNSTINAGGNYVSGTLENKAGQKANYNVAEAYAQWKLQVSDGFSVGVGPAATFVNGHVGVGGLLSANYLNNGDQVATKVDASGTLTTNEMNAQIAAAAAWQPNPNDVITAKIKGAVINAQHSVNAISGHAELKWHGISGWQAYVKGGIGNANIDLDNINVRSNQTFVAGGIGKTFDRTFGNDHIKSYVGLEDAQINGSQGIHTNQPAIIAALDYHFKNDATIGIHGKNKL